MALTNWLVIIGAFIGAFWFTWWLADRIDKQERVAIEAELREKLQREAHEQQMLRDWQQQQQWQQPPPRW